MTTQKERYFNTLGFTADDTSKRQEALKRAYTLRTFEIEHYWKRATYFWGFQLAIFAAFGLLWRDPSNLGNSWAPIAVALSGLGVLTATANYLSARGSKFWQQNWEKHIDMLEDDIEGRLHKTVWLSNGCTEFSVSRVNQRLGVFLILFWIVVTFYVAKKSIGWPPLTFLGDIPSWGQFIIVAAAFGLGVALLVCEKTRLYATEPDDNGGHGKRFEQRSCWCKSAPEPFKLVRRYAPYE